jgi:hypothetical protein
VRWTRSTPGCAPPPPLSLRAVPQKPHVHRTQLLRPDGAAAWAGARRNAHARRAAPGSRTNTAAGPVSPMAVLPRDGRSTGRWLRVQALGACAAPRAFGVHTPTSRRSLRAHATSVGAWLATSCVPHPGGRRASMHHAARSMQHAVRNSTGLARSDEAMSRCGRRGDGGRGGSG